MKAYIQTNQDGSYYNVNAFVAARGFQALGFETFPFYEVETIKEEDPSAIVVGGIGNVRKRLRQLNIPAPEELEYPEGLKGFLHRAIWKTTLNQIIQTGQKGIFVKPVQTKLFAGKVIRSFRDYIDLKYEEEVEVWCSAVVEFVTEWRCFIRYGEILDVRYYKGRWDSRLDLTIVEAAIESFTDQPNAFSLDFGVDSFGKQYLVEVNDGHSLGTYGMSGVHYAKFLSARWSEMTKTIDPLRF